jgi:hypothetical protein
MLAGCASLPSPQRSACLQLMSRGYIASAEKIRDRLLISEWELARKQVATRRRGGLGVGCLFRLLSLLPGEHATHGRPTSSPRLQGCDPV